MEAQEGEVYVEIMDALQTGELIPGFGQTEASEARGVDELWLRPRWQNHADLSSLKGKTVRLKFHLRNATLYAFQVGP